MSAEREQAIVITGASGHVGSAVVRRLAQQLPLALLEHGTRAADPAKDGERVARFGGVELGDEASVASAVAAVRARFGAIRGLVHTVGGWSGGVHVEAQPLASVRHMLEINFISAVNIVKALLPDIIAAGDGRIVLFASGDALRGRAGSSAYAASKAALLRFAEALADEVAPRGVGVRVVAPTTIDTPVNRAAMPSAKHDDWVTPDEIADTVAFLLDRSSSALRFATIPVGR